MLAANGLLPSNSARLDACAASSLWVLRVSNWARKSASSERKLRILSKAFSCFAGLSSCLVSWLYSSMVREKAVKEADKEPMAAGDIWVCGWASDGGERWARSLRMAVLCFRAELKDVFFWACC